MAVIDDAAAALVERWAPAAPVAVKAQAVAMAKPWLALMPEIDLRDGSEGASFPGPRTKHAIIHSGAGALLAPWRVVRAHRVEARS